MKTFKTSGSLGDIIHSIPTIRSLANGPATIYLNPDVPDSIPAYAGQRFPFRMPKDHATRLLPLLNSQPDLQAELWTGQRVDFDLDQFRLTGLDFAKGDIARYCAYAFPQAEPILHEPWLTVDPDPNFKDKVIVNRTLRYRNPHLSYRQLAGRSDTIFIGLAEEYTSFIVDCPRIPHHTVNDFRELASIIKACKLFVGNQSMAFSISQALMVPRILEVYRIAPNVVIHGPNGSDVVDQRGLDTKLQRHLKQGS